MSVLYPLKFKPVYKERIWGGSKLRTCLGKDVPEDARIGESWEISAVPGNTSVVENGFLKGNSLDELCEIYMDELMGGAVYDRFGKEFPLLIKFIDASDILSLQLHPDDDLALERHGCRGKTEMWYVMGAEKNAKLISGFNKDLSRQEFLNHIKNKTLPEVLNYEKALKGDAFYIPAGRIHAIGKGIMIAEIQQSSDITYRVYDWGRVDDTGKERELHVDLAIDAIDLKKHDKYKTGYIKRKNEISVLADSEYFTTGILEFDRKTPRDYTLIESFVIYICIEGNFSISCKNETFPVSKGETLLLPAALGNVDLIPEGEAGLLEVFIK